MSELTLENLNNYIETIASKREVSITCGESNFKINLNELSKIGKINIFIDKVVSETYLNITSPNYFFKDIAFIGYFLKMFTDFPVPFNENDKNIQIDVQATYDMVIALNVYENILVIPMVNKLYEYVNKQIEFENQKRLACLNNSSTSNDAIETVANLAQRCLDAVNIITDQVEMSGSKLLDILHESDGSHLVDMLSNLITSNIKGDVTNGFEKKTF